MKKPHINGNFDNFVLFFSGIIVCHLTHDWGTRIVIFLLIIMGYVAGWLDTLHNVRKNTMSGGKIINCQFCKTRITKRLIRGTEEIWNDSTGNRICPQNGDGSEQLPHVPEGVTTGG